MVSVLISMPCWGRTLHEKGGGEKNRSGRCSAELVATEFGQCAVGGTYVIWHRDWSRRQRNWGDGINNVQRSDRKVPESGVDGHARQTIPGELFFRLSDLRCRRQCGFPIPEARPGMTLCSTFTEGAEDKSTSRRGREEPQTGITVRRWCALDLKREPEATVGG